MTDQGLRSTQVWIWRRGYFWQRGVSFMRGRRGVAVGLTWPPVMRFLGEGT